ncbi:MAG: hypothetical protein ABEI86_06040 [Halobacteriaceae archaeon]
MTHTVIVFPIPELIFPDRILPGLSPSFNLKAWAASLLNEAALLAIAVSYYISALIGAISLFSAGLGLTAISGLTHAKQALSVANSSPSISLFIRFYSLLLILLLLWITQSRSLGPDVEVPIQ